MHVFSGVDLTTGAIALTVFMAGAMLAMLAVFGVAAFRRAGQTGLAGTLWRGGLVLVGIILAWIMLDRSTVRDRLDERRALESRSAELTMRAIMPGSALACIDTVASPGVEAACERALFASPEAVAAAVAYVDARYSLFTASLAFAESDPSLKIPVERLRRSIEADRYGLVAHVLMTRGCTSADCPELKRVRDTSRIIANMRARTFDTHVGVYSIGWNPSAPGANSGASPAPISALPASPGLAASGAVPLPAAASGLPQSPAPATAGGGGPVHYEFPSAASIPPVSIMDAEPASELRSAARRPAQNPPRHSAPPRQAAPVPAAPAPQTSGSR